MYIVRALWGCIVQVCRYYGYDMALRSARTTVKLVVFMVDLLEQNDTEINELVHVLIIRFNTPFSGNSVQVTHWTPTQLQTPWSATTKDHFTTQTHCRLRMSNWVTSPRAVWDSKHLHHFSFNISNQYTKRRSVVAQSTNSIRWLNIDALYSHWRQRLKAIHACHRFRMLSIHQRFSCTCPPPLPPVLYDPEWQTEFRWTTIIPSQNFL